MAQPQQQAEAGPEADLVLEEIGKLILPESHKRVAQVDRVQKRLVVDEAPQVRKLECSPEIGTVRVVNESRFQYSTEPQRMLPVQVGGDVLELQVLLLVIPRDLSAAAVECAVHQDRGRIAHAPGQFRPVLEIEAKFVQEARRRNCGLR